MKRILESGLMWLLAVMTWLVGRIVESVIK